MFSLGDARTAETTEGWLVVQDCAKKKEYVDACSFTLKSIKFLFTWPSTSGAGTENISRGGFKISRVLRVETWPNSDRRFYPDRKQWQQIGKQTISRGLPKHVLAWGTKSVSSALNIDSGDWRNQTRFLSPSLPLFLPLSLSPPLSETSDKCFLINVAMQR